MWGQLFIFISAIVSLYIVFKEYSTYHRDYKMALTGAGILLLISQVLNALNIETLQPIQAILLVIANSTLLTSFLILIRILKPEFLRYSYFTVFIPFILPIAYVIVLDSLIMQSFINISIHSATISVYIILCIGYWNRLRYAPRLPIISIILLLFSFTLYWILDQHDYSQFLMQLFLALGMIFSVYTFSGVTITEHDNNKQ